MFLHAGSTKQDGYGYKVGIGLRLQNLRSGSMCLPSLFPLLAPILVLGTYVGALHFRFLSPRSINTSNRQYWLRKGHFMST